MYTVMSSYLDGGRGSHHEPGLYNKFQNSLLVCFLFKITIPYVRFHLNFETDDQF